MKLLSVVNMPRQPRVTQTTPSIFVPQVAPSMQRLSLNSYVMRMTPAELTRHSRYSRSIDSHGTACASATEGSDNSNAHVIRKPRMVCLVMMMPGMSTLTNIALGGRPLLILGGSIAAGIDDDRRHRTMFLLVYGLWALTLAMWNWMRSWPAAWIAVWAAAGVLSLAIAMFRREPR